MNYDHIQLSSPFSRDEHAYFAMSSATLWRLSRPPLFHPWHIGSLLPLKVRLHGHSLISFVGTIRGTQTCISWIAPANRLKLLWYALRPNRSRRRPSWEVDWYQGSTAQYQSRKQLLRSNVRFIDSWFTEAWLSSRNPFILPRKTRDWSDFRIPDCSSWRSVVYRCHDG